MKEQTKKRIASALLAGTLLFTTGCTSKNKKNDDNNKVEPPKVVIDVDQNNTATIYQEYDSKAYR